jgi:hypothetical protein
MKLINPPDEGLPDKTPALKVIPGGGLPDPLTKANV